MEATKRGSFKFKTPKEDVVHSTFDESWGMSEFWLASIAAGEQNSTSFPHICVTFWLAYLRRYFNHMYEERPCPENVDQLSAKFWGHQTKVTEPLHRMCWLCELNAFYLIVQLSSRRVLFLGYSGSTTMYGHHGSLDVFVNIGSVLDHNTYNAIK